MGLWYFLAWTHMLTFLMWGRKCVQEFNRKERADKSKWSRISRYIKTNKPKPKPKKTFTFPFPVVLASRQNEQVRDFLYIPTDTCQGLSRLPPLIRMGRRTQDLLCKEPGYNFSSLPSCQVTTHPLSHRESLKTDAEAGWWLCTHLIPGGRRQVDL